MKRGSATGVDAVCTYQGGPSNPSPDREKIYWELSNQTNGLTRLGPYTIEQKSFYLDGEIAHWGNKWPLSLQHKLCNETMLPPLLSFPFITTMIQFLTTPISTPGLYAPNPPLSGHLQKISHAHDFFAG